MTEEYYQTTNSDFLQSIDNLPELLVFLLRRKAIQNGVKNTSIRAEFIDHQSWSNHQNGRAVSQGSLDKYIKNLAISKEDKNRIEELYLLHNDQYARNRKEYKDPVGAINRLQEKLHLDNLDFFSLEGFDLLVKRIIDCRNTKLEYQDLIARLDLLELFLDRYENNADIRHLKKLMLAFAIHLNGYYKDNSQLQARALGLIHSARRIEQDFYFQYVSKSVKLYWSNKQDKSVYSSDAMHYDRKKLLYSKFIDLEKMCNGARVYSDEYLQSLAKNYLMACRYNIASLGIEVDRDNINIHRNIMSEIDKFDENENVPPWISIYNKISDIEFFIRVGDLDRALISSEENIDRYSMILPSDNLQIAQLQIKQIRALNILHSSCIKSSALKVRNKIMIDIENILQHPLIRSNGSMKKDLVELKDEYDIRYD